MSREDILNGLSWYGVYCIHDEVPQWYLDKTLGELRLMDDRWRNIFVESCDLRIDIVNGHILSHPEYAGLDNHWGTNGPVSAMRAICPWGRYTLERDTWKIIPGVISFQHCSNRDWYEWEGIIPVSIHEYAHGIDHFYAGLSTRYRGSRNVVSSPLHEKWVSSYYQLPSESGSYDIHEFTGQLLAGRMAGLEGTTPEKTWVSDLMGRVMDELAP